MIINRAKKILVELLVISNLFNPLVVFEAFAQEVYSTITPISDDNFVSDTVTVYATVTDSESSITGVSFRMFDYWGENEQSCNGEQGGDAGQNWYCQIDTTLLSDSNDEAYDMEIEIFATSEDGGFSNTYYYSDNNNYFDVDNTAPIDPFVGSSSHNLDEPSDDNTVDIFLEGGDDSGSGIDGFSFSFTQGQEDLPDENKDIEEDGTNLSSEELEDGLWYFHLRTVDYANNWTSTVHLGPFLIDAVSDLPQPTPTPTPSPVATVTPTTSSGETVSSTVLAASCNDQKPGSAPTLLSAISSENDVALSWSKAKGPVSYYLVAYGLSPNALQFGNPNIGGKDTTSFTVEGLSGGVTYYFKVRAGNGCMPGDYSNELSATLTGNVLTTPAQGFIPGVLGSETSDNDQPIESPAPQSDLSAPSPNLFQRVRGIFSTVLDFFRGLF